MRFASLALALALAGCEARLPPASSIKDAAPVVAPVKKAAPAWWLTEGPACADPPEEIALLLEGDLPPEQLLTEDGPGLQLAARAMYVDMQAYREALIQLSSSYDVCLGSLRSAE